jgi:hypothetical protein
VGNQGIVSDGQGSPASTGVTVLGVAAVLVLATALVAGAVLMSAQDAYGRWAFLGVGAAVMLGGAVLAAGCVVLGDVLARRELQQSARDDMPYGADHGWADQDDGHTFPASSELDAGPAAARVERSER